MKRAIVLGGGGSKGAYQLGVWKALQKLQINYDIITGTSIGSINGAFMVTDQIKACEYLWISISNKDLYNEKSLTELDTIKNLTKAVIKNKGIDTLGMEEIIKKYLNINRFFSSPKEYGLITYNKTTNKAHSINKNNLTKNNLIDYLMASSSLYPIYKPKVINNHHFIDGGYHDTLPINLAIELGATEIIAVDLNSIGLKQKVTNQEVPITYIKPKQKLSNIAHFNTKSARKIIKYGYNDTLKVYKYCEGNLYTFKKKHLENIKNKYNQTYTELTTKYNINPNINSTVELLANYFELDDSTIYSHFNYVFNIKKQIKKTTQSNTEYSKQNIKIKNLKDITNNKWLIYYLYQSIKKKDNTINIYSNILKKQFQAACLLYSIMEN